MKYPFKISVLIVGILSILLIACTAEKQVKSEVQKNYSTLTNLISVGMDIDEATTILKNNGFTVGEKHSPTAQKDYYQVNVPLTKTMPKSATIAESTGKSSDVRIYAIIIVGLDNKITSISN